jgi:hypothetical protein
VTEVHSPATVRRNSNSDGARLLAIPDFTPSTPSRNSQRVLLPDYIRHLPITAAPRHNSSMSGSFFLLYLCATAAAPLCLLYGLLLFAVRRFRRRAPYVALVYPAMFCGAFLGVVVAFQFHTEHWWREVALPVFLACLLGGGGIGGFIGYKLADQIARHFQQTN